MATAKGMAKAVATGQVRAGASAVAVAGLVLALAGCAAPDGASAGGAFATVPEAEAAAAPFLAPVQVNAGLQEGFEPSLRIGPSGTLYVAAARGFLAGGDGSAASPAWRSQDGGATWQRLESPAGVRDRLKAIEGDLAVDGDGSVWLVDTNAADNVLTQWDAGGAWVGTRPVQGTLAADDRPWLAAHGSGVLYYLGNSVAALPAPEAGPAEAAPIWLYRSADGGRTWSLGAAMPGSMCHLAASPADDRTAVAVCVGSGGIGAGGGSSGARLLWSADQGVTWAVEDAGPADDAFPSASFAADGTAVAAWRSGGRVRLAAFDGAAWAPVAGPDAEVGLAWVAAAPGRIAVAAYVHEERGWFLDAMTATGGGGWARQRADPDPVGTAPAPPQDFFQAAYDADGLLHIAYQRDGPGDSGPGPKPFRQAVLHVRQAA